MAAEERMRIEVRNNTYDEKEGVIVMNSALVSSWNFALDHWRNHFGPGNTQLYPGSDLVVREPCSLSSRLGPGACDRCGRVLITRPDHYDVCTLCFRGLCYECGATCNLCFGSFCHGFCHCGCQQELGDAVVAPGSSGRLGPWQSSAELGMASRAVFPGNAIGPGSSGQPMTAERDALTARSIQNPDEVPNLHVEARHPVGQHDGYCERCGYFFYKRYLWVCPRCSMQLCVPRQCASRHVRYCAGMGPRSPLSIEIQAPHGGIVLEGSAGLGRRLQGNVDQVLFRFALGCRNKVVANAVDELVKASGAGRLGPPMCERCGMVEYDELRFYVCCFCFRGLCCYCARGCGRCLSFFCWGHCRCICHLDQAIYVSLPDDDPQKHDSAIEVTEANDAWLLRGGVTDECQELEASDKPGGTPGMHSRAEGRQPAATKAAPAPPVPR